MLCAMICTTLCIMSSDQEPQWHYGAACVTTRVAEKMLENMHLRDYYLDKNGTLQIKSYPLNKCCPRYEPPHHDAATVVYRDVCARVCLAYGGTVTTREIDIRRKPDVICPERRRLES